MTSAVQVSTGRETSPTTGRTYGYVRASTGEEVKSPEAQAEIIAAYCQRIGRPLDEVFSDDEFSGGRPLPEREGGRKLVLNLRKGDHVVAARLDRMFRSFIEFGGTLDEWDKQGIVLHLCDMPIRLFDPANVLARPLIDILVRFSASKSGEIASRSKAVSDQLKAQGRRNSRFPPYGSKWEKRGRLWFEVPEPNEQIICIKAAEMRIEGYSWDQIRQHLAYRWRVRNRVGKQFGQTEVRNLVFRGAKMLHEAGRLDVNLSIGLG